MGFYQTLSLDAMVLSLYLWIIYILQQVDNGNWQLLFRALTRLEVQLLEIQDMMDFGATPLNQAYSTTIITKAFFLKDGE